MGDKHSGCVGEANSKSGLSQKGVDCQQDFLASHWLRLEGTTGVVCYNILLKQGHPCAPGLCPGGSWVSPVGEAPRLLQAIRCWVPCTAKKRWRAALCLPFHLSSAGFTESLRLSCHRAAGPPHKASGAHCFLWGRRKQVAAVAICQHDPAHQCPWECSSSHCGHTDINEKFTKTRRNLKGPCCFCCHFSFQWGKHDGFVVHGSALIYTVVPLLKEEVLGYSDSRSAPGSRPELF